MRVARVVIEGKSRVLVQDGDVQHLAPEDVTNPLDALDAVRLGPRWERVVLDEPEFLEPLTTPGKLIAVGLNYADHTAETGFTPPERPLTFAKYASSIVGTDRDVVVPDHLTSQVDYEVELTVVIGRDCGGDKPATLDDIAGYTIANDLSARDVQFGDTQWTRAKSFDGFTPLGPWIVTPDEFGATGGHRIWTEVDGERLQDDTTSSMVFDIPALLAFVGDGTTLRRGDLILTGTPAGAGGFRTPPRFLQHGETVVVGVEGIGEIRNRIVFRSRLSA